MKDYVQTNNSKNNIYNCETAIKKKWYKDFAYEVLKNK